MKPLRRLIRAHPAIAALIVVAALALRIVVPAGFMPTVADGRITISICSGYAHETIEMTIPGLAHHEDQAPQVLSPCAFADLALPAIAGADPVQLASALGFILATALLLAVALPPRAAAWLRPPLRGPPLTS